LRNLTQDTITPAVLARLADTTAIEVWQADAQGPQRAGFPP
jgi:protocatechuate 3,4-dioxygenase beta subunit